MLSILHEDEDLIAIHKPNGLLVHRTKLANDASEFALQLLRDQIDHKVYPAHRLDRKTSGVLVFTKNEEANRRLQVQFMEQAVSKKYFAIVRGWTDDVGTIDYSLINDAGKEQDAVTHYKTIQRVEIDLVHGIHKTSRYSFVEVTPESGRMHQIRKHFAHILHPIIGDRPHGCNKQNRLFKTHFGMTKLLLHAAEVSFKHPMKDEQILIQSQYREEFKRMTEELGFTDV
ncbi:MAG: tRNA pseudouridine65 synthase [Crocinitomicaceae bacterium]|jgi:tRNA pseudouridine65 synthase